MSIYKPGRPQKYNPSCETGNKPPSKPGEYRIRDDSGKIRYIGETCNLNRRMHEHIKSGKLNDSRTIEYKVADGRSTSKTRREHEREKIAEHSPDLNKSKGGEGRRSSK